MTTLLEPPATTSLLTRLALEVTHACQAHCGHCYNDSGPSGTDGEMTREDWLSVLAQAAACGARQVQFIGGEPTLYAHLPELINAGVEHGMAVEVFSNLIHIRDSMWPVLRQRGVTLATSYYSSQAAEHDGIMRHRGAHAKTAANIATAVRYRIPVRVSIIDVTEGQNIDGATAELRALGVTSIRTDRVRGIGRAATGQDAHQISELCGRCARGRAAVMPNGDVAGCVMSGALLVAGNVRTTPLREIITSPEWAELAASIPAPRGGDAHEWCSPESDGCQPHADPPAPWPDEEVTAARGCTPDEDSCQPTPDAVPPAAMATACNPDSDGSDCAPAETEACGPSY